MASIFDVEDSSDSENDVDYVPEAALDTTDDEDPVLYISEDDDEEVRTGKNKKPKSRVSKSKKNATETKESEDCKPTSTVDEKKKADDLFKSFLEEAAADMKEVNSDCTSSGISCSSSAISTPLVVASDKSSLPSSSVSSPDKFFGFEDEKVSAANDSVKSVSTESPIASEEKKKLKPIPAYPVVTKKRGLEDILGVIENKKAKQTVLQKTQLDWKSFKEEEGLEEDLEQFNRGKGGFIERQRFLERSDLRSYQIERDMRMAKRKNK